ncbi:MAG: hypothetical protein V3U39_11365, partial [Acidimicrobiia bacterium]
MDHRCSLLMVQVEWGCQLRCEARSTTICGTGSNRRLKAVISSPHSELAVHHAVTDRVDQPHRRLVLGLPLVAP